mgnify:CR=1 FL=1
MLSIIGIFGILNNTSMHLGISFAVVICFQLLVSLVFWTTILYCKSTTFRLWFAFNYWYLWYSEQLGDRSIETWKGCDLLSIIGIFGILNNRNGGTIFWQQLWFAFNYWYLWYSEQHPVFLSLTSPSCDLLSIIGIFGILNNYLSFY